MSFEIIPSISANPDATVFNIHVEDKLLREVLVAKRWDSIRFSGGLFDTLMFMLLKPLIGIAEPDIPNELIIGMSKGGLEYTQNELDSIASLTFKEAEIDIYYNESHWKLKPLEKDAE
jgi:hypothetical protein